MAMLCAALGLRAHGIHKQSQVSSEFRKEKPTMLTNSSIVRRTRLFRASLLIVLLAAVFASQMNVPAGAAPAPAGGKGVIFDIVPDPMLSTLTSSAVRGATFYMQGTIYKYRTFNQCDCTPLFSGDALEARKLGTWRASGTVADSSGKIITLHQTLSFDLPVDMPGNGTIEVQGVNGTPAPNGSLTGDPKCSMTTGPSELLAVVGGSGQFYSLNGQAVVRPYCNPSSGSSVFRYDRTFCLGVE
jgi:hypothetical protein